MNPRDELVLDELVLDVRAWLDTWAPNCGAPRSVFEGQFKALMKQVADRMKEPALMDAEDLMHVVKRACKT